ncbi:MAG: hypothetical protein MRY74_01355 [Neomegalonema sp.]|nr:hypothetical protein [Neomegalonema sp.]
MLDMTEATQKGETRALRKTELSRAKKMGAALSRRRREYDFSLFRKNAAAFFDQPHFDAGHRRMEARAGYSVSVSGDDPVLGGAGGNEARVVEVAYGASEIRHMAGLTNARLRGDWVGAQETGAALLYAQGVDGAVTAFLYPARIENMKPEEDAIILARYADIELLTGRGVLENHWRAFRAYAEVTSLEGEPSWADHARVAWLRFARPIVRDGRRMRTEALDYGMKIASLSSAIMIGAGLISLFV